MLSFLLVQCCGILSLLLRRKIHPSFQMLSCEDNMAMVALATARSEVFQGESVPNLNCSFPLVMFLTSSIEQNCTWRHICSILVIIAVIFSSPLCETDFLWSCVRHSPRACAWWEPSLCMSSCHVLPEVSCFHRFLACPLKTLKAGEGGIRERL